MSDADVDVAVGWRSIDVADDVQHVRLPLALLYPTRAAAAPVQLGPYTIELAVDAAVDGDRLPLVVISHGNSASPWVFRELAGTLARAGFVVALPEHLGNSRSDNRLAGTPANLANRPRHVRLAIDAAIADPGVGRHVAGDRVAVIGHSIGGYTALSVAGGRPHALPSETPDGIAQPVDVVTDPRVRAVVLLAPAVPWFMGPGALAGVTVPILVRAGELDVHAPPAYIDTILRGLGDVARARVDQRVIPNAGHFSFLDPFPPAMSHPGFPPSQDPPGFDRAGFLPILHAEILTFVRAALA